MWISLYYKNQYYINLYKRYTHNISANLSSYTSIHKQLYIDPMCMNISSQLSSWNLQFVFDNNWLVYSIEHVIHTMRCVARVTNNCTHLARNKCACCTNEDNRYCNVITHVMLKPWVLAWQWWCSHWFHQHRVTRFGLHR